MVILADQLTLDGPVLPNPATPRRLMDQPLSNWRNCLEHAALSDVGLRRANNQDAMAVVLASSEDLWRQRGHLFMVADGMGAHAAGELASKMAADTVSLTYSKRLDLAPYEAIRVATQEANSHIYSRGQASEDFRGMGTTCTALLLLPTGSLVAHVGDSRAYRLRGDRIEQLTRDHSLVWEIRALGKGGDAEVPGYIPKNIITRSLGPNATVQVDLEGPSPIQVGDVYLLCSDGLSGQVHDKEIGALLSAMPSQEAARALVELAKLRGGPDNITVIIVRVTGPTQDAENSLLPASADAEAPPDAIPTLSWALLGFFGLGAALSAMAGSWVGVAACLTGAAATAVGTIVRSLHLRRPNAAVAITQPGGGPYVSTVCTPDDEMGTELAAITEQLRDAAIQEDWTIEWLPFNARVDQARSARQSGDYSRAIREYCGAITSMMEQLKRQPNRGIG